MPDTDWHFQGKYEQDTKRGGEHTWMKLPTYIE